MTAAEKEYGGALYQLAAEEHCEDDVLDSVDGMLESFRGIPEYPALLQDPALPKDERLALLDEAFGGSVHPYALNFVKILCEARALSMLSGCEKAYRALLYEARGILPATASSAVPLTAQQTAALQAKLEQITGKHVLLETKVDPSLLGGVKVRYEGKELDGTVQGRMETLRRALMES